MQFTDLPVTPFTLAPSMSKEVLENYIDGFIDHLGKASLIARSSVDASLHKYVQFVDYADYSATFDNYWHSVTNETVERILTVGIQTASLVGRVKPPAKTILRDIAKVKIADALLTRYTK
jgi:hypothetical protein